MRERLGAVAGWVTLALAELVLVVTWWPSRRNEFGIIDDHGIVALLGGHHRMPLGDVLPAMGAEAFGANGRVRPLFMVGWVLEAATAGDHVMWWYVDRLLLATITLVALTLALRTVLHPVLAALVSLSMLLGPQFETWVRLGPAEAYAMPLLAMGLAWVLVLGRRGASFARLAPGLALMALSAFAKESFLLVSGPAVVVTVLVLGPRSLRRKDWVAAGVLVAVAAFDAVLILVQILTNGQQYVQVRDLDTARAWSDFAMNAVSGDVLRWYLLAVVLLAAVAGAWRSRAFQVAAAVVVVGSFLQVGFYAGGAPAGRYLYPVVLALALVWVLAFGRRWHGPRSLLPPVVLPVLGVIAVMLLVWDTAPVVGQERAAAAAGAQRTQAFRAGLDGIEQVLRERGLRTVVIQPYEPRTDLERVVALAVYLRQDTAVQVMVAPAEHPTDAFSKALARQVDTWSREGSELYGLVPYDPPERCFSIVFSDQQPDCRRVRRAP